MKIGVYGDCHLTKNMRTLQDIWDVTASESLHYMYNTFDEENVEMVVCLGDFFDSPRIEAKHMSLILPILKDIESRAYPTYILLGNHEADNEDSNILDILGAYDNIHPVTTPIHMENMLFLPYYVDPTEHSMRECIVFTHHDIYGSSLAGGKTSAFFGLDPALFNKAKLVMNGHVHLKSKLSSKIMNTGSLLVSQQGELRLGDLPSYYTLDTRTGKYDEFFNKYSMIYLTVDEKEIGEVVKCQYDSAHLVLKIEYEGEIPENMIETAHTSWKKKISDINSTSPVEIVQRSQFDLKNYLVEYIKRDITISDTEKENYIKIGLELLS